MSLQLKVFWTGLAIYAVSFFLLATGGSSAGDSRMPGFFCAFYALVFPWVEAKDAWLHNMPPVLGPVPWISLLVSGLINPVFLTTAFLDLTDQHPRAFVILRILVVVMIPFCWIFFYTFPFGYPREGHFVWIIGMLLTLFSRELVTGKSM